MMLMMMVGVICRFYSWGSNLVGCLKAQKRCLGCSWEIMPMQIPGLCPPSATPPRRPLLSPTSATARRRAATPSAISWSTTTSYNIRFSCLQVISYQLSAPQFSQSWPLPIVLAFQLVDSESTTCVSLSQIKILFSIKTSYFQWSHVYKWFVGPNSAWLDLINLIL